MRPLITAALVIALLGSALPVSAQSSLSINWIRYRQAGPIDLNHARFRFPRDAYSDLQTNSSACVAFKNTDARTATAVRFTLVFYDAGGVRSGSQIFTSTGTFGKGIEQGAYNDKFTPNDCFNVHLPDSPQATIAYYVDSVDFADGSKWVAEGVTLPNRVINGTLLPVAPPAPAGAGVIAPEVSAGFANCRTALARAPAPLDEHTVFVDVQPGAPVGDGLYHVGAVSPCRPSADPARDALAVATVEAMPAAIVRDGAFRVSFSDLTVSATCTAPVRLMDRKLVDAPLRDAMDFPGAGDYIALAHVSVRADGYPVSVQIVRSSHQAMYDDALRQSAFATRYWPAIANGAPVDGTYEFAMRWLVEAGAHPDQPASVKIFGPPAKALPAGC